MTEININTLEIWKPVSECTDYEVSNLGRVRRAVRCGRGRLGQIIKPRPNHKGYMHVGLRQPGITQKQRLVHRLVTNAFLGPIPEGLQVNHKDGVKSNNRIENLEYVTNAQNRKHAFDNGLFPIGERAGKAQTSEATVREIKQRLANGERGTDIAADLGVPRGRVYRIKHGRDWKHVI